MSGKKKKHPGQRGSRNIHTLDNTVEDMRSDLRIEQMLELHNALKDWNIMVGERLGPHVKPILVKEGILFVKADGAAWMQEFNFVRNQVVKQVNENLGRPIIKDIRFKN